VAIQEVATQEAATQEVRTQEMILALEPSNKLDVTKQ
jgi:hypothetical protein